MHNRIQALYDNLSARVVMMGITTDFCPIKRGTRQGYPLSPQLFVLYLEPFIQCLMQNAAILSVKIRGIPGKITAYADDIAIFSVNPITAIVKIKSEARLFGELSGYLLNVDTTQIVNNGVSPRGDNRFVSVATYLGIQISSTLNETNGQNLGVALTNMRVKLSHWNRLPFDIQGRCNVIKMTVLPKLLF